MGAGPQAAIQWLFDNEGQVLPPVDSLPAPSFTSRPAEPNQVQKVQSVTKPLCGSSSATLSMSWCYIVLLSLTSLTRYLSA